MLDDQLERLDKLSAEMLEKMNAVMVEALEVLAGGPMHQLDLIATIHERTDFTEHGIRGSLRLLEDIGLIERRDAIVRLRKQPEPPAPPLCKFGEGGDYVREYTPNP